MGNITSVIGPMGSGKSKTLLEIIGVIRKNKLNYTVFKPQTDTRIGSMIKSRNGMSHDAIEVGTFLNIYNYILTYNTDVIIIDEVQFFSDCGLKELVKLCKNKKIEIIAAGLNLTSELDPFTTTAELLCYSDKIIRLSGVCGCNKDAKYTEFIGKEKKSIIEVGGDEKYRASCENCHKEFKM